LAGILTEQVAQGGAPVLRLAGDDEARVTGHPGLTATLDELLTEIAALGDGLRLVRERLETDEKRHEELAPLLGEVRGVTRRLQQAGEALAQALRPPTSGVEVVRWIELSGKPQGGERNVSAHCVPLALAPVLRDDLFGRLTSAVVTSATLATDGGFGFLVRRLGLAHVDPPPRTAQFPSPFDYRRQALLAVPTDLPAPNEHPAAHLAAVTHQLQRLVEASDGGVFGLFTSHRDVRAVAEVLRARGLAGRWPLLVHGEEGRDVLLQRFRDAGRAVLLGTATFWEGIDVPGDALRAVLLAKLPFRVPTEPMVAAQCEAIEARGGNSFVEYMLPHASLRLKQGFGRLIRTGTDRGVVVLADPRVVTKRYGRGLLAGLPPARQLVGGWGDIEPQLFRFYGRSHASGSARERLPEAPPAPQVGRVPAGRGDRLPPSLP
jgi:ATP-dependent DNA helicase DinG